MICLVDVNLPKSFSRLISVSCIFITDVWDGMPDSEIWKMALQGGHVILTRDKDFYYRAIQSPGSPKVVLFRLGNCRSGDYYSYFTKNIALIEEYLKSHRLIVLWPIEIQVVI